jgi:hypothetical protein
MPPMLATIDLSRAFYKGAPNIRAMVFRAPRAIGGHTAGSAGGAGLGPGCFGPVNPGRVIVMLWHYFG